MSTTTYRNRIIWDLNCTTNTEKSITSYFSLPQTAGAYGAEYCLETAPPVPVYDLTASNLTQTDINALFTDFNRINSIFVVLTNAGRQIQGRAVSMTFQEIAGTARYSCSLRLKSTAAEMEVNNNFVIYSYTALPH